MEKIAYCIGNGKSRQPFDLEKLRNKGTIIGCNALYRDFIPDVLVAIDSGMIYEIADSQFPVNHPECHFLVPANRTIKRKSQNIKKLHAKHSFNSSGGFALQYAGQGEFDVAYMLGFDCYQGNIYSETFNYNKKNVSRFDTFIRYYESTIRAFSNTQYINVTRDGRDGISASIKHPNYKAIDYSEFENIVENTEDREIRRIHTHYELKNPGKIVKELAEPIKN